MVSVFLVDQVSAFGPAKISAQESHTYGIASFLQSGMATRMLLKSMHNLDSIELRFLNLLPPAGHVLWHRDLGEAKDNKWYVLAAKLHGVVVVKLHSYKKNGGGLICRFDDKGTITHDILYIRAARGWHSIPTRASPPIVRADSHGLLVETLGKGVPLLEAAAERGFAGMTATQLQQLLTLLGVEDGATAPTLLQEVLSGLLRHCLPKLSDAQIKQLAENRSFENV